VVVYQDPLETSSYNRFDADPWFCRAREITVGKNNTLKAGKISFYPNPVKDVLNIKGLKKQTYRIYNATGMEIERGYLQNKKIALFHLHQGIYTIVFEEGMEISFTKE
jgi:hypothetical protein